MDTRLLNILFLIFALSGFSGLIYESIWTHYLKLFLGHAAYAQTLVLAIFMGGMALGSWICSIYSVRWKNLFLGYALAEGIIGLFALVFHNAFVQITQLSYTVIFPQMGTPLAVNAFKWTVSTLLILPQSILLGMTFPLMSSAILRIFPQNPGGSISMLYFTNSIGAVFGVLASGFMLIGLIGLPGTIRFAGLINVTLALIVWLLTRDKEAGPYEALPDKSAESRSSIGWHRLFLAASLITGTASFIYEVGWIRMLSLVLGGSTHAFELMLSAFILGLAFGGLWIRHRIDHITDTVRFLAVVQVIMGILALSTLPLYGNTFGIMQWILKTLSKTDTGYTIFNLSGHAIALIIMLPTTFCAGTTLPLITYSLIKQGDGERSIGAVYAANTVGAIIGVFFAIHIGMPLLGLKGLIILGACLDIGLGLILAWSIAIKPYGIRQPVVLSAVSISAIVLTLFLVKMDPYKMASGVYREGKLLSSKDTEIIYQKDGKTATISVSVNPGIMSIRTNGKVDAGINIDPEMEAAPDEITMVLSGAIPMAINPQAKTAANIGFGSGLTTHTLLTNRHLERVDTIEIEKAMVEAARNFGDRVKLAYTDPRSKIYIDDAKTFFSSHNKKYDIIISEPSNPWVSGVAGLFSEEFYRLINRHLTEDGLFVQWIQVYEIDLNLVSTVFKAISSNFSDFAVYAPSHSNILIVARNNGIVPNITADIFNSPETADILKSVRINNIQDLEIRKIGNKKVLYNFFESFPIRANSDYYPVLDQNAARTRFLQVNARDLIFIANEPLPVMEMLAGADYSGWGDTDVTFTPYLPKAGSAFKAMALRDYYLKGSLSPEYAEVQVQTHFVLQLKRMFSECGSVTGSDRIESLFNIARDMVPYLRPRELELIWESLESGRCGSSFTQTERDYISFFKAVGRRDAKAMAGLANTLLEGDTDITPVRMRYLVAAGMLGSLSEGNKDEAYRLWSTYISGLPGHSQSGTLFRFLVSNSLNMYQEPLL